MFRPLARLVAALATILATPAQDRPNILLIVADDMGYGDLSCYGSRQIATPNIDRLAHGGVRCTAGYVSAPVCAPSRAGLLTGRSGSRFGFEHNLSRPDHVVPEFAGMPLDEPLISDRLQHLGYRTGLIGKWHQGRSVAGHHPQARGFETFFGLLDGHHDYWPTVAKNRLLRGHDKPTRIRTPYLTDWLTLEANDFVRAESHRPWFLFLSYTTPHSPMQCKPEDLARFAHIKNKTRRIYCAMQHCLDENIGKLLATLEATEQLDDTLIVFLSDNGGSVEVSHAINAPLRGTKGTFLEGGLRVPMICHWPARLRPLVFDPMVSTLDLMATFVTAAGGVPPPPGERVARAGRRRNQRPIYDSVDLVPFFTGERQGQPHAALYWRMALRGSAIRVGRWKLLRPNSEPAQLYDLASDVSEQLDRSDDRPGIAQDLLARLNAWEATCERNPIFVSAPRWSAYNQRLYEKRYMLQQPAPDDPRNHWRMPARRAQR
ncbi:MAG: sulfatase-like hydrolase/transferase [bacterium]|nr:sulfatase-like hydrolase/transferase [bacterium]